MSRPQISERKVDKLISTQTGSRRATITVMGVALLVSALLVAIPTASEAAALKCAGKTVTIVGTTGDDVLDGTAGADVIHGLAGDDILSGLDGADTICGGEGNDVLKGGVGADKLFAGPGNDTVKGGEGNDTINGSDGNDTLRGGLGRDTIDGGEGKDTLYGDKMIDTLTGGIGWDYLNGGDGDDILNGGAGNDRLTGRGGADTLYGNQGDDALVAGGGTDVANGGNGEDRCSGETEASCELEPLDYKFERFLISQAVPQADSDQPANQRVGTVEKRAGIVRVFVTANQPNTPAPVMKVHWRVNGTTGSATLTGPAMIPTNPDIGDLSTTYNHTFDETLLLPGADMYVVIDPNDVTLESNESNNRYPSQNWRDLDTQDVPKMKITVVPITIEGGASANISQSQALSLLDKTFRVHPVGDYNVQVRSNYLFENPTGTFQDWITLVNEMLALQQSENPNRQYHAFLPPGGLSPGIGGIGWIGLPAAVSIQNQETIAHETGHNLDLPHAPCGGPDGPDPNYPYAGGGIGTWGYDIDTGALYDPAVYVDLMTYCSPEWVSDYNFANVLEFRTGTFGWESDLELDAVPAPEGTKYVQFQGMVPSNWAQQGLQENLAGNVAEAIISRVSVVDRLGFGPTLGDHRIVGLDAAGNEVVSASFRSYPLDHAAGAGFIVSIPIEDLDLLKVRSWNIEKAGQVLTSVSAAGL